MFALWRKTLGKMEEFKEIYLKKNQKIEKISLTPIRKGRISVFAVSHEGEG